MPIGLGRGPFTAPRSMQHDSRSRRALAVSSRRKVLDADSRPFVLRSDLAGSEYRSSLLTHFEATELGERTSTSQSHRRSAAPISSCHCWVPWMLISLYQTGVPWRCRTSTSPLTNCRSKDALAWVEAPSEVAAVRRSLELHPLVDWTEDVRKLVVFPPGRAYRGGVASCTTSSRLSPRRTRFPRAPAAAGCGARLDGASLLGREIRGRSAVTPARNAAGEPGRHHHDGDAMKITLFPGVVPDGEPPVPPAMRERPSHPDA